MMIKFHYVMLHLLIIPIFFSFLSQGQAQQGGGGGGGTGGGGSGTVTSVSVVSANGVSGTVANQGTTPALTISLGAITPSSVNGLTISTSTGVLTITNGKTFTSGNTLTLAGTDGSMLNIGAGGMLGALAFVSTITSALVDASICSNAGCSQNTSGSAASLSISGQTGLMTVAGLTSTNRVKTVRDAADTLLELGGSYSPTGTWTGITLVAPALGTPASGVITNLTGTCTSCGVGGNAATATTASAAPVSGLTGAGTGVLTALGTAANATGGFVTSPVPAANLPTLIGCPYGGTTGGSAAAQTLTVPNIPTAIAQGTCVSFTAGFSAAGATTLTVTPTGQSAYAAINLMKRTTGSPAALGATGDMPAGAMFKATYDGTQWELDTTASTLYTGGSNAAGNVLLGNANNQTTSSTKLVASNATGAFSTINNLAVTGASGVSTVQASPTVITIGSGTSIGNTSLCSTTLCPAGTYTVHAYLDITTACSTSGTYAVNLLYTDDQGAKTTVVNFNGSGAVPATGLVTTTSTSNFGQETQVIRTTGAANNSLGSINYSTTAVACGSAGPMIGNLYLSVTREQ